MRPDFSEWFKAVCPTPRKARYLTLQEAMRELARVKRTGHTEERPQRAYQCECGWWHLTRKPYQVPVEAPPLDSASARR